LEHVPLSDNTTYISMKLENAPVLKRMRGWIFSGSGILKSLIFAYRLIENPKVVLTEGVAGSVI